MRALLHLLFLNLRGTVRWTTGRLKNPRQIGLFLVSGLVGVWLIGSAVFGRQYLDASDLVGTSLPLLMLGVVAVSWISPRAQRHIFFSKAEIAFLFAGPFSPRHLLAYKLLQGAKTSALAALIFGLWFSGLPGGYLGAFFASWLALLYISAVGLGLRFSAERLGSSRIRVPGISLVVLGLILGLWQASSVLVVDDLLKAGLEGRFEQIAATIRETWLGMVVLIPFEPFGELFSARSPREFVRWAVVCLCLYALLTTVLFSTNFDFRDASIRTSGKLETHMERVKRGDMAAAFPTGKRPRVTLPMFPSMGGAGALLWRQLLTGLRGLQHTLLRFLIPLGVFCIAFFLLGEFPPGFSEKFAWGILVWMTMLLSGTAISCDFRADIRHLDTIKMLPISPRAVIVGQILPPTLLIWLIQLLAIAVFTILDLVDPVHAVYAAVIFVPFNVILFEAENLAALLFPAHPARSGTAEISARAMLVFLMKAVIAGTTSALAAGFGAIDMHLSGELLIGMITATLLLAMMGFWGIAILARTFQRFDLSHDTPSEEG